MNRILLFLLIGLFPLSASAQVLNKLGKIYLEEIPKAADHQIKKIDDKYKVFADSLMLEGNTYYNIPDGYITSLQVYNKEKDYIKQYDARGKLLATIFADRILNLKLSKTGKELAFYNTKNIIYIDLKNYSSDTLDGSFVYAFLNDNSFIYYNSENKTINHIGKSTPIEEYPNLFIEFKNRTLVITKNTIFELTGSDLIALHKLKGEFFDVKIIEDAFYFVDRIEKRKSEDYTLYKTSDFTNYIIVDKLNEYSH